MAQWWSASLEIERSLVLASFETLCRCVVIPWLELIRPNMTDE